MKFYFDPSKEKEKADFIAHFMFEGDQNDWINTITPKSAFDFYFTEEKADVEFLTEGDEIVGFSWVDAWQRGLKAIAMITDHSRGAWTENNPLTTTYTFQRTDTLDDFIHGEPEKILTNQTGLEWQEGDVIFSNDRSDTFDTIKVDATFKNPILRVLFDSVYPTENGKIKIKHYL